MIRRFLGDVEEPGLLRCQRAVLKQRHHAQHAVERGADLVTHVGEEHALRTVRRLGVAPGAAQTLGQRFEATTVPRERAQLVQHHDRQHQQQQVLKRRQRQAQPALLAHRAIALGGALVEQVRGAE